ncbi:aldehyde dehydrogenase (NADP(+)) [Pseudonocardia sp. HH130630-07]|uniref:aldehyde dehydrogenase (NADP(+)) n=1 Tax=Pseudonocardia sp. HH130630-07 TaxID=1690815 RepID=UPI000814DCA8|nr:aldehyde dehydrogenase (NADP(+)) [Pseudonocardia sp. HH130630-07]ANY08339.1 aldehyde dehydrogenase [Pseudonocardia sp. HH130630-07]
MTDTDTDTDTDTVPATTDSALEAALAAAAAAATDATPGERAARLDRIADALDAAGPELIPLAARETHLPERPRLAGELARTTFQLRLFAEVLREGRHLDAAVDHADPGWPMGARPDIRRVRIPIGPVLVFAASNFPFAFSVAGGDSAAALAAGCPVLLKAHPGHEELSRRTGEIVRAALADAGAPEGTFAVVHGVDAGVTALRDPRIAAAAFTGSVRGGRALFDIAAARPRPIPFYGELGSLNPVVVTPAAAAARGERIAQEFAGSFTLGAGQFCTKPGLLLVPEGHGMDEALVAAVGGTSAAPLLNDRIEAALRARLDTVATTPGVELLAEGTGDGPVPTLLRTDAATFRAAGARLHDECFGPVSLLVTYSGTDELVALLSELEPGLTATVQGEPSDAAAVGDLLPALVAVAGRLLWNQWPTGVTVSWAQQHGGPYPATTAPTTTSVGTAALERFLRPVAWQNFPDELLPDALREANPWQLPRRVDGVPTATG